MDCDGPKHALVSDIDGLFLGSSPAEGSIVPFAELRSGKCYCQCMYLLSRGTSLVGHLFMLLPCFLSCRMSADLTYHVFLQLGLPVLALIFTTLLKMWFSGKALPEALLGAYTANTPYATFSHVGTSRSETASPCPQTAVIHSTINAILQYNSKEISTSL